MIQFVTVTKEVFESFLKDYPYELVQDTVNFCEPPVTFYYDFKSIAMTDKCSVARIIHDYNLKTLVEEKKYAIKLLTIKGDPK